MSTRAHTHDRRTESSVCVQSEGPERVHARLLTVTDWVAEVGDGSINVDLITYSMYFKIFTVETYCACNEDYNDAYEKTLAGGKGGWQAWDEAGSGKALKARVGGFGHGAPLRLQSRKWHDEFAFRKTPVAKEGQKIAKTFQVKAEHLRGNRRRPGPQQPLSHIQDSAGTEV